MKTGTLFAHLSQGNSQLQLGNAITHFPPLQGRSQRGRGGYDERKGENEDEDKITLNGIKIISHRIHRIHRDLLEK